MEFLWEVGQVGAEDDNQMEGFRPPCVGRWKCRFELPPGDGKVRHLAPTLPGVPPATVEAVRIGCSWMEALGRCSSYAANW